MIELTSISAKMTMSKCENRGSFNRLTQALMGDEIGVLLVGSKFYEFSDTIKRRFEAYS